MAPTSGLVDMFEKMGVLTKQGNKLQYISRRTGEISAEFRKNWTEEKLMMIMAEWDHTAQVVPITNEETTEAE
jgi:hypothetical protein